MKIFLKIKALLLLLIISFFLFDCNTTDQLVSRRELENNALAAIHKNGASPDKINGKCPYQCHDPRCMFYAYGYCGPAYTPIKVVTNPNNPYDYAGAEHNTALQDIDSEISPSTPNVDSVIEVLAKNYAVTHWGTNADSIQLAYDSIEQQWDFPSKPFPALDSLGNELYGMGKISNKENYYIQQMSSAASQWLNVDSLTQGEYNNFASSLILIENQIKNDDSLGSNEESTLLIACAIERYSAEYWGNYINEQSSSSNNSAQPLNVHPQIWRLLARVLSYAVVDVEGAATCSEYAPPVTPGMAGVCITVGVLTSADYAISG